MTDHTVILDDGVIAFGGGSALDVGKAVALMVGQTRPIWDFEDREDWYTRVNVDGMAPAVAVPTTAGTGAEVGRASVITDERDHTKKIIFHPRMLPSLVIADPERPTFHTMAERCLDRHGGELLPWRTRGDRGAPRHDHGARPGRDAAAIGPVARRRRRRDREGARGGPGSRRFTQAVIRSRSPLSRAFSASAPA